MEAPAHTQGGIRTVSAPVVEQILMEKGGTEGETEAEETGAEGPRTCPQPAAARHGAFVGPGKGRDVPYALHRGNPGP